MAEDGLCDLPRQVDPLRSPVPAVKGGEFPRHHLAARSPHRDRVGEGRDVLHAGDADLPGRELAGYPASLDEAAPLGARVTPLDTAADAPAQQQPVNLLSQLLRRRGEADPDSAGLLPGDVTVGFEVAEYPCPSAEFEDAILLPWPVRKGYLTEVSGRLCLAAQSGRDLRRVPLQGF